MPSNRRHLPLRWITVLLFPIFVLFLGATPSSAFFQVPDGTNPYSLTCKDFRTQDQAQRVYDGQEVAQNGFLIRLSDEQVQLLDRDLDYRACENLPSEAIYEPGIAYTLALMFGVQSYRLIPRKRRGGGLQYEDTLMTTFLLMVFSWPAIFIPTLIWDEYPAVEQVVYSTLCGLVFGATFGVIASAWGGGKRKG